MCLDKEYHRNDINFIIISISDLTLARKIQKNHLVLVEAAQQLKKMISGLRDAIIITSNILSHLSNTKIVLLSYMTGIAQESVKGNDVESHFLTLASLALNCEDLTFHRELQPISGLDIIGDGLSFIVKRGSVIAAADPPSVAWKISKARLLPSAKITLNKKSLFKESYKSNI